MFAGHHQPLKVRILCLYFMGLHLSHAQIANELDVHRSDVRLMTTQRREGIVKKANRDTLKSFEMMQRGGQVVIKLMVHMKQKTIEPFIKDTIVPGTRVY